MEIKKISARIKDPRKRLIKELQHLYKAWGFDVTEEDIAEHIDKANAEYINQLNFIFEINI